MLENKKIESIRNRDFIDNFLRSNKISPLIASNPRYQSVLWRLSYMLMDKNLSTNNEAAKSFLNSVVKFGEDGSVTMMETTTFPGIPMMVSRYYIDPNDEALKRLKIEFNTQGEEDARYISVFNEDGIEEELYTEPNIKEGNRYATKTVRLENRPDIVEITVASTTPEAKILEQIYQSRIMWPALEDLYPDRIDIDPFDTAHFSILGLPPLYKDLDFKATQIVKSGRMAALSEKDRTEQFERYKELNKFYSRTTAFENGIAKMLCVRNKTRDKE